MTVTRARFLALAGVFCLFIAVTGVSEVWADSPPGLDNASCLACHDVKGAKIQVTVRDDIKRALAPLDTRKFAKSIHSELQCVACHTEIVDSQAGHKRIDGATPPNCITCHETLWKTATRDGSAKEKQRLGLVVENIVAYKQSFHASADKDRPGKPKAFCEDCHASHEFNVPPENSERRTAWHKEIPNTCGAKCHEDQLEAYAASVHGEELLDKNNVKSAVCTDCHTAHDIINTSSEKFKLTNVDTCGGCHKNELSSYTDTYHGQVNRLGYSYTAKCVDCHDSHGIRAVDDPKSKVHPDKRMKTCMKCHSDSKPGMHDATAGFVSFGPHANAHDFKKYPQLFIASKFMIALLIFVFAFFWAHSGLWYYREWMDRKKGKTAQHIDLSALGIDPAKHFKRFPWGWRAAHLAFALITMTLVLTGTTALFAQSSWAPAVATLFGGPKMLGFVHRIAATLFIGIFVIHFLYVMQKLLRDRSFRWFGPDSLLPNWKDLADCWGMFKWFLGKGPRPQFERWAYYEKFDYWAVFWGVNIIGWSGLLLAFPHVAAQYLPGWMFNVATLVHGEEAFLAAVFLFTVHFFNNHFRPDKLPPPDVVMFTGTQSLEEFRNDHPAHFKRMVETGEISKYLVEKPSAQFHAGSVVLGLFLIGVGLTLLVLVGIGFLGG
ncbi:MAG: cytochrome b/b6 domain-containing protein [Alphaproteobacteria bacterium]|nr:cytochrome b/b6 domain-containing protein [Alphaproteobacteria bacterium]